MGELLYPEESYLLVKIAMQLYNELGCGFTEKVYQDAFEILLDEYGVPYEREKHQSVVFHGVELEHAFFFDFLCYDDIVVELKARTEMMPEFRSQVINYLHVGGYQLGLVLNFGGNSLEYQWVANRDDYCPLSLINKPKNE